MLDGNGYFSKWEMRIIWAVLLSGSGGCMYGAYRLFMYVVPIVRDWVLAL